MHTLLDLLNSVFFQKEKNKELSIHKFHFCFFWYTSMICSKQINVMNKLSTGIDATKGQKSEQLTINLTESSLPLVQ